MNLADRGLHLIGKRGVSVETLTEKLYNEAGLLGLSGVSAEVAEVMAAADAGDARAPRIWGCQPQRWAGRRAPVTRRG